MIERVSRKAVGMGFGIAVGVLAVVGVSSAGADGSISRTPPMGVHPAGVAPLPPPPLALQSAPPGSYPVWPVGATATSPGFSSAADVARDLAMRALGISDPTVTESAVTTADGIGIVTISLPAASRDLEVVAQRRLDGSWIIIQVGDQSHLEGITMLPGGKPGPIMLIHPPAAAVSADVSEVAADGTHEIHLTAEDLRAGVAHLVARDNLSALLGEPIHTVLIVYRDGANRAIDALGGEYA
jgi:hypothetical protein